MKVLCSIDRAWSSNECVCCDPELRAGLQPFALLMLFLCVILNNNGQVRVCNWYIVFVYHHKLM